MSIPYNITSITNTDIGKVPPDKQGVTVKLSGTFGGTTASLAYGIPGTTKKPIWQGADASKTAAGEIGAFAGAGDDVYIKTVGGSGIDIDAVVTFW